MNLDFTSLILIIATINLNHNLNHCECQLQTLLTSGPLGYLMQYLGLGGGNGHDSHGNGGGGHHHIINPEHLASIASIVSHAHQNHLHVKFIKKVMAFLLLNKMKNKIPKIDPKKLIEILKQKKNKRLNFKMIPIPIV